MDSYQQNDQRDNLFSDELENFVQFEPATKWQRFFNFLIDMIVMRYTINYFSAYVVINIIYKINPEFVERLIDPQLEDIGPLFLLLVLLGIMNFMLYYGISEKAIKGQTVGKLITGTRAIRKDGGELTFKDSVMRALVRLVPFEVLSMLFNEEPWHDEWTKTTVVKRQ